MPQLVIVECDSSISNKEIKANFADTIEIQPNSTIALQTLECTLADDPNNDQFIPPAGTSIGYTLNNGSVQTITLNSATYLLDNMLSDINQLLNTQTGYNPNDLAPNPTDPRPAEPYYGVSHVAQLNSNGLFTLTTYDSGMTSAGFNDNSKWILASGVEGNADDEDFTNVPTPNVGVDLLCFEKLSYMGFKMQYTVASTDPFDFNIWNQGDPADPEYSVICQGQGNLFQLKIGTATAIDIGNAPGANMVPGDQIILYKQRGNLRVELWRAGLVIASTNGVLTSDPYSESVVQIFQGNNLNLDIQNVQMTFFNADGSSTVNMVTTFTDLLASYLGLARTTYTYSGEPAVLVAEKNPQGSGNYSGIKVICNRFRVKSYQGSWETTQPSKSVLRTVSAVNNKITFEAPQLIPLDTTNAGVDILGTLSITLERNGRRLAYLGPAYASFIIDYKD